MALPAQNYENHPTCKNHFVFGTTFADFQKSEHEVTDWHRKLLPRTHHSSSAHRRCPCACLLLHSDWTGEERIGQPIDTALDHSYGTEPRY